jgi:hypothetical protein
VQIEAQQAQVNGHRESRPFLVATTTILAIIVVWFLVFEPVFRSARISATSAQEEKYVRDAAMALDAYVSEHGDKYPDLSRDMTATLKPYIKDPKALEAMSRFEWNDQLSGKSARSIRDPHSQWVVYSEAPGTTNYAFGCADGFSHHASSGYLALVLRGKAHVL